MKKCGERNPKQKNKGPLIIKMNKRMQLISRRKSLSVLGAFGVAVVIPTISRANTENMSAIISKITMGKETPIADMYFELPEIAENGNQVKVSFEIDSPMTPDDYVKEAYILADGNPAPNVAKFMFTPYMGSCAATTRMRLAKTQNVYLLAGFSNGEYAMAEATVKVTIGGCGG